MSMSKKDFAAIADAIADNTSMEDFGMPRTLIATVHRDDLLHDLCAYFKSVNPNFDEARFRRACTRDGTVGAT